jgi:hypothetical protein
MKSSREKLQRRIDSLEANMAFLAKEYSTDKQLASELASYAHELMEDANVEDQPFVLAQIDRLGAKYNLPHGAESSEFSNKPGQALATGKCAHPRCACKVSVEHAFCSDYCKTAVEVSGGDEDEACKCGHSDCVVMQAKERLEERERR